MKGAIFDVDGTLLDSMNAWYELIDRFFREHGSVLSDEQQDYFKELTLNESIPMIIDKLGLSVTVDELLEEFKQRMFKEYAENIPPKAGALEYVRSLHDSGVKIAIATSGYEGLCKAAFMRLGVWDCIDACAFSAEVGVNKSNPDVYLLAAQRIGVLPEECVVFEDILRGIGGAKKGGFTTCAVYDDSNANETDTLKQLADYYITDWSQAYEILKNT